MSDLLEIKPGIGLCDLSFGSTMDDAEKYFGNPDEKEVMENGADSSTVVWHYWNKGFSLFFDEHEHSLFTSVEIDHDGAILWGNKIFDMQEEEIIAMFQSKGYHEMDTENHEWGEKRVSFDDALIDLYFEGGELVSVNYGAFLNENKIYLFPN